MMSNETLSSAATPPKRRLTSRTESNGSSDTVIRPFDGEGASAVDGFSADRCAPLRGTKIHTMWGDDRAPRGEGRIPRGAALASLLVSLREFDLSPHVDRLGERFVVVDRWVVLLDVLLGDGVVIGLGIVDRNTGVHERIVRFAQRVQLIDYRLTGQVWSALLEHVDQAVGRGHAVDVERIFELAVGVVLGHDLLVQLDSSVVGLARVGRVLQVGHADDAVDRRGIAGGFLGSLDIRYRRGDRIQIDRRMP